MGDAVAVEPRAIAVGTILAVDGGARQDHLPVLFRHAVETSRPTTGPNGKVIHQTVRNPG